MSKRRLTIDELDTICESRLSAHERVLVKEVRACWKAIEQAGVVSCIHCGKKYGDGMVWMEDAGRGFAHETCIENSIGMRMELK